MESRLLLIVLPEGGDVQIVLPPHFSLHAFPIYTVTKASGRSSATTAGRCWPVTIGLPVGLRWPSAPPRVSVATGQPTTHPHRLHQVQHAKARAGPGVRQPYGNDAGLAGA